MTDFKMTFTDEDFGDKPKPKMSAKATELTKAANEQLAVSLPKMASVYEMGKAKDYNAKQLNLAKFATYGSKTYGKLGFDPYKAATKVKGQPKTEMDKLYDDNTSWTADVGRAWDGMWKLAGIGFQDTIGLGAFADSGNYLDFEDTMSKYSSTRGGNVGFWANTGLSAGYTGGIILGIAAEEMALAGITAASGGLAAPGTVVAGGTLLARGVERMKQAGNMLSFVNKLQDVKTASGFMGKLGASAKGFGKALNPLENTMDFLWSADKLKDINGWKQTALGVGSIVRDARKITMSHSESKLEADLAQKEFKEKMYDDWYSEDPENRAGKAVPDNVLNRIEQESQKLHSDIYRSNFGLIYATNAITFDNMLKTMKGTNKFFSTATDLFNVVKKEGGKVAVEAMKKNVWNYGRKKLGDLSWQGTLKSMISSSMEGFQELGQDVISESNKSYYARNVKGTQVRGGFMTYLEDDLQKAISKQNNEQGLSTFLSGALMGVFASPVGGITQLSQKFLFDGGIGQTKKYFTSEGREGLKKERAEANERRKEKAKMLTEFFNDNKNFADAWSKPIYSQSELQEEILQASQNGDQKTMKSKQHESMVAGVHMLLESGMEKDFAKHLTDMAKTFEPQHLNEIFGRTDITEENKGEWQGKLKKQAENVKGLRRVYDEINNTVVNPINIKTLDRKDPQFEQKLYSYLAIQDLRKELLFSHAKIADRASRQAEIRTEINNENPLSTLEVNALLDANSLNQQIQLLKTEIETNSKLTVTNEGTLQNMAASKAKLKAYENYQKVLTQYKLEQLKEDGVISQSDKFDDLFDAYYEVIKASKVEPTGEFRTVIDNSYEREYSKQQFNKIFDYLELGEEGGFYQRFIDTVLNPQGSSAFIQGREEMHRRLDENKEEHILTALYEYDKKRASDDMLNTLYENDLFFNLDELDELMDNRQMPKEIFDVRNNKLATPEQYEMAQQIIGSYIKKLTGKTITNDKTGLNKQGRKLKSDKRTVATILRTYNVKLNKAVKLSSKEGKRLMDKLTASDNNFMTSMDKEILAKLGELDVTIKFVSDNTLPVQLTEDGVLELDVRFTGKDYTNSVMSFENLVVTGLTQFAITEKLKTNDDLFVAARSAMEQAKREFAKKYIGTNVEELAVFNDVNVFMTEAMNDLQFQKFLGTIEDNVQPASQSLWKTLSDGISDLVEEDFDKKLANRVINIAAKALDDTIVDNVAETQQESKEVREQREEAQKEKAEELTKLAKELGERWNVNVQVINSQDEAREILNKLENPFEQRFSQILNDLMYPPVQGIDLRKVINPELVNLKDLLRAVMERSGSLSELIANIKELSVYQTNSKVFDMVNFLTENADNIGDAVDVVKNIFFQTDKDVTAGFYDEKTNTAYIVADAVKENTLYHEIFLHPFLINLEKSNPEFYKQLVTEAKANQDIIDYVEKNYGTEQQIGSRQFEHELVGRAYDLSIDNKLSERKEPGLFKKIGQFIKKMITSIGEFLNLTKTDVSRFNPKKTTIADLANYSVNSDTKINLGKVIEADKVAQSTEETVKPRTRKKTVQSVRTIIEEQTVNKGGDLIVLDNARDRPDIFGDFLHPEIEFENKLLVSEWTQKLVDLGKELDDARITNWVYGNIRAQVDGRLVIDVEAEIPVFVKKALQNKKANPKVKALQDEIASLDKKIQDLNSQRKTTPVKTTPAKTTSDTNAIRDDIQEIRALYDSDYLSPLRTTLWSQADSELKAEAKANKSFFGKVKEPTNDEKLERAWQNFLKAVQSTKDTNNTSELNYSAADGLFGWGVENSSPNATTDLKNQNLHPDDRDNYQGTAYGTTSWAEYYEGYSQQGKRVLNIRVPVRNVDESTRGTNRPSVYLSFTVEMPEGFTAQEVAQPIIDKFKKIGRYERYSRAEAEKIIAADVLATFKKGPKAGVKVTLAQMPVVEDAINTEKVMGKAIYIPMSVYEAAYANDTSNNTQNGQPLAQIIARGGYAARELDDLLPDWKERVYAINNPEAQSAFDELNVEESLENDALDKEIEAALKERNALQDQLNSEEQDIIEEGEEVVQQGTKKVKFLMYKSTGLGSSAESAGEWVPLLAFGKYQTGEEWFVKSIFNGQDPKFNKYGSSVFADIDRDLKTKESTLFTEPENWVTETTERQVVEETEIEEEIPIEEQEAEATVEDKEAYRPRTEILNDLTSIENELKKLETKYDALMQDINSGKLSAMQKRKAKRNAELLAIDINDLYSQLNDMRSEIDEADAGINLAVQDLEYVPVYDYNGNEVISHQTPWMDVPQSLRNELAELFGKPLNKLNEEDVVKIKENLKTNPEYIAVVNAFTQERLRSQDEKLASEEAQKNRQRVEEQKLKNQQRDQEFRAQSKAEKKQRRLAKTKVTDEDILKSVLKDFDYSILTSKEIKQLIAKLKDKTLPIRFTADDIIAYISNKKAKQAQKEQAKKDIEEQKAITAKNAQIKSNMALFESSAIPFLNSKNKRVKLRVPNNGMRKFIMTYHSDIFALPRQEFLNALNQILRDRITYSKPFQVEPKLFVKGDKKIYLKIYNLVKRLEKDKLLFPDIVKKINLALYDVDSNWRIKAAGKNGLMSSMYQIKKVTSTKRITPPGIYGSAKKLIFEYQVNEGNPSQLDYHIALIKKFASSADPAKVQMSAIEDVFGPGSADAKAWKSITSNDAGLPYRTFDSASLALLEDDFEGNYKTAEAFEDFLMSYENLTDAIKKVSERIKNNAELEEGEKYDEELEPFFNQGMNVEEAASELRTLQFLNSPEGQEILDAEAAELDRLAAAMENELINGEFDGNEDELSDTELELLNLNEPEEEAPEEEIKDVESLPIEEKPVGPISKSEQYLKELNDLASLPFQNQKDIVLGQGWKTLETEKQSDLNYALALYKYVTASKFAFSQDQIKPTLDKISKLIGNSFYFGTSVLMNGQPYSVKNRVKGKVVLQNLQTKAFEEFEIKDFLNSVEQVFAEGDVIPNLNVDTVVKVEEFAYIKGAYNDILNNFTSYMGEANSLSEEDLLSNLKKETTKCK